MDTSNYLRVARRRGQVPVPEQDLDDADVGPVLQQVRREAVAQRVDRHALGQSRRLRRRAARRMQHGRREGMVIFATWKEIARRSGETRTPPARAVLREQGTIARLRS